MNNNNNNKQKRARKGGQRANQAAAFNALSREIQGLRAAAKANGGNARPRNRKRQGGRELIQVDAQVIPNAVPVNVRPRAPQQVTRNGKTFLVGHENIATVSGSVAFTSTRYQVNPGLSSLVPWLSGRASGYEKYRVVNLEVMYVPAEAVVTTPGVVYLAWDYDPDDGPPTSLASLSSYEGLRNSHTYQPCRNFLNVREMQRDLLKIRTGPKAGSRLLYDPASIIFSTVSMANANAIGQLWLGYEIEVLAPQNEPAIAVPSSLTVFNQSSAETLVTTVAEPVPWDEVVINGLEIASVAGVITMPIGVYKISGAVVFNDDTAEVVDYVVAVWRNGAALTIPAVFSMELTSLANGRVTVPFIAYVAMTAATDTLQIQVTATGAAGTKTIVADGAKLFIEAV